MYRREEKLCVCVGMCVHARIVSEISFLHPNYSLSTMYLQSQPWKSWYFSPKLDVCNFPIWYLG